MSGRILKYTIQPNLGLGLSLPVGSKVLSVSEQMDNVVIYIFVNDAKEKIRFEFRTYTTGVTINKNVEDFIFIGTVNLYGGRFMLHVFVNRLE